MYFKVRIAKFGSAWVAPKVSNLWPKTWILICEKEKSGPHEWRIKCLIFELKNGFLGTKLQIWVRACGVKVPNFEPKTWILSREKEKSGPREWRKKCQIYEFKHQFYYAKRQIWVRTSGALSV